MAIYKEDLVNIDLENGNIFRSFLTHTIGSGDNSANRFGVKVYRAGVAEDLSGCSCQAIFMNNAGVNIALTSYGTVSGNVAYVTLPQACYNVEGQFCLAIKLVKSGVTVTSRIVDGVVCNTGTTGSVAPTGSVPTYQEVLAVYDEAIAAVDDVNDLKSAKANYANVGFNQWDEVWEIGGIANGANNDYVTNSIRSKNYIPVDASKKYYFCSTINMWVSCYNSSKTYLGMLNSNSSFKNLEFALMTNTAFIRFAMNSYGTSYNNDICINISQTDTSIEPHNGEYKKYQTDEALLNRIIEDEKEELTYRDEITSFGNVQDAVSDLPNVEKVTGYSANISGTTSIFMSELATMDSYAIVLNNDTQLYFDDNVITQYASAGYLSLCYINNAVWNSETKIMTGTNAFRVRNLESNLPSDDSPITLSAGSGIVVTLDTGTDVAININGLFRKLSDNILLNTRQIKQIENTINLKHNRIAFNGTTFSLKCGDVNYYIVHETDNTIRQDTWRVKQGSIVHNNAESDMWNGSDADGVVRLKSENDFIGGYHGDEITTDITVFIDGVEADIETSFAEKDFKTFAMFVSSNVYHCIDSSSSANVAFTRNKVIYFDGEKLSISNYWVASETVNVTTAYFGMLSVAKSLVTNYSLNSKDEILDNTQQGTGSSYCDHVKMFLNTGNVIEYYMSERSAQVPFGYGELYSGTGVANRVKAYFAEIYKLDGLYLTLNQGDVIRATSTMIVH